MTSYRDVVKKVLPAVVSIEAKTKAKKARPEAPAAAGRNSTIRQIPEEFRRFFQIPDMRRDAFRGSRPVRSAPASSSIPRA